MSRIVAFARFWWDFVVGDDGRAAAGVLVALALTAGFAHGGLNAWWFLPLAVCAILYASLQRATRK